MLEKEVFLNASSKPSKFRTSYWVEINNDIRVCTLLINILDLMLSSNLCDYSDAYILVKGNISVNNNAGSGGAANNANKKVIFKNCVLFTKCISKINNTQIFNSTEYSGNYSKTSESL